MARILVYAPYYHPHVGGVELYIKELDAALWASGDVDAITVLAPDLPAGGPMREREPDGTTIIRYPAVDVVPNFPVPRFWTRAFWRARRDALATEPDLIVGHTRFFVAAALAALDARLTHVRHVHVEHGSDYVQMGSPLVSRVARAYDRTIGRAVLRLADQRIAVSQAAAAFVSLLARRPAEVVYRGIPRDRFVTPRHDRQTPTEGPVPIVVFAGRLIAGKGVHDLIAAADGAANDLRCMIVGSGPQRDDLERQVSEARHPDRFRFVGQVSEDDVLDWLSKATVVVNPSYTEGLPSVVLWAAALGRPVLATDVGGTGEIVRHESSGLLVRPGDPVSLRQSLDRLLDSPELRGRLAAHARESVWRQFDSTTGAARWLAACLQSHDADRRAAPSA